jgi:hypothetical protein
MAWWRTRDATYWREKPSVAPDPAEAAAEGSGR